MTNAARSRASANAAPICLAGRLPRLLGTTSLMSGPWELRDSPRAAHHWLDLQEWQEIAADRCAARERSPAARLHFT